MNEKRTTVHLALDIEETLRKEVANTGMSFKEVVNKYLRLGLNTEKKKKTKKHKIESASLQLKDGIDLSDISDLLEQVEGPDYK